MEDEVEDVFFLPVFDDDGSDGLVVKGVAVVAKPTVVLEVVVGFGVEFVTELEPCEGERVGVGGDAGELLEAEEPLFPSMTRNAPLSSFASARTSCGMGSPRTIDSMKRLFRFGFHASRRWKMGSSLMFPRRS